MEAEEFIDAIKGKKIKKLRIGDSGFDVVFENGIVLETYDMCLLFKRMCKALGKKFEDCTPFTRDDHEKILKRLVDRVVLGADYNVDGCIFRLYLDNGDVVCIPDQYGYVIDYEDE